MGRINELRDSLSTSAELAVQGRDSTELLRLCRMGTLIRVRQGVYTKRSTWNELDKWDRYRMLVLAVDHGARSAPLFSHETAAVLRGVPVLGVPGAVHVQLVGSRTARSRNGVRRHYLSGYSPQEATIDGLRVAALEDTLSALAAEAPFMSGLMAVDWALRKNRADPARISAVGERFSPGGRRRLASVLEFSNAQSGSPGESASRACMLLLGFPAPQLQTEFRDVRGFVARTDFYWREYGLVGEFDGRVKYQKPEYLKGRTASEVVVEEKRREDRLRALGLHVVRWLWEDIHDPGRLRDILLAQGLPMRSPLHVPHLEPALLASSGRTA